MKKNTIQKEVFKILKNNLSQKISNKEIEKSKNLYEDGILDSYALTCLILDIEKKYKIDFQNIIFNQNNFKSLKSICKLITKNEKS